MTNETIVIIRACLKLKKTEVPKESELYRLIDKALKEVDEYSMSKRVR